MHPYAPYVPASSTPAHLSLSLCVRSRSLLSSIPVSFCCPSCCLFFFFPFFSVPFLSFPRFPLSFFLSPSLSLSSFLLPSLFSFCVNIASSAVSVFSYILYVNVRAFFLLHRSFSSMHPSQRKRVCAGIQKKMEKDRGGEDCWGGTLGVYHQLFSIVTISQKKKPRRKKGMKNA